jgi:hypothetical protein
MPRSSFAALASEAFISSFRSSVALSIALTLTYFRSLAAPSGNAVAEPLR